MPNLIICYSAIVHCPTRKKKTCVCVCAYVVRCVCFSSAFEVAGAEGRVWVSAADRSCPQVLPFLSSWIPVCAKPRGLTLAAVSGLRNAKHCLGEGCSTWQPVNKCMEDEQVHGGVEEVGGWGSTLSVWLLRLLWKQREGKGRIGRGGGRGVGGRGV